MEVKLDRQRVQEFARKLFGHYTSGILTLLVDVGHKTGLFEAVAEGLLDMVAMTRAHMADPQIVNKLMRGEEEVTKSARSLPVERSLTRSRYSRKPTLSLSGPETAA